jgi:hypothetical protein
MHTTDALYKQVKVTNNMLITIAIVTYDVSVKTQESGTNSHRKLKNNVFFNFVYLKVWLWLFFKVFFIWIFIKIIFFIF